MEAKSLSGYDILIAYFVVEAKSTNVTKSKGFPELAIASGMSIQNVCII